MLHVEEFFFEGKLLGVTATSELVANEHNPVIVNEFNATREEGTALTLPIRVHLKNPLLMYPATSDLKRIRCGCTHDHRRHIAEIAA